MTQDVAQGTAPIAQDTVQKDKELNFERLRKQLEQEKAEKLQLQQKFAELERAAQQAKQSPHPHDEEEDTNEPYVDHKSLTKKFSKWEQQLEQKFEKRAEEKARSIVEQDRQANYVKANPDFQEVLTQENIEKFAQKHPSIAERMLKMPDNFDRQALLYEQIKALQVNKKEEAKPTVQQTIDANRRSPYYQPSGVGTSPYAPVGDFSPGGQKAAYDKLKELKSRLRI
jgi:hypothetical protein